MEKHIWLHSLVKKQVICTCWTGEIFVNKKPTNFRNTASLRNHHLGNQNGAWKGKNPYLCLCGADTKQVWGDYFSQLFEIKTYHPDAGKSMRPLSAAKPRGHHTVPAPSWKSYFRHKCLWALLTQGRAQPVAGPCPSPASPWRRANLYLPKRMALPFCLHRLRASVYINLPPIFPQNNEGSVFASF